jgi:hypothetical protein
MDHSAYQAEITTGTSEGIFSDPGLGTILRSAPPMISTFPSYKGHASASHVPLQIHEADVGSPSTVQHESETQLV